MSTDLKKIECGIDCGFLVRSHDERELIDITKSHAKKQHKKDVTDDDLRSMIKTA